MSIEVELQQWLAVRSQPKAMICDIDETLCTQFDLPIPEAISVMKRLAPEVEVFYVTARPTATKAATLRFLEAQELPWSWQLHLCEPWKSTSRHKLDTMAAVAKEYDVVLSIGDAHEDEVASLSAGVPFLRVDLCAPEKSWQAAEALLTPWLEPVTKGEDSES